MDSVKICDFVLLKGVLQALNVRNDSDCIDTKMTKPIIDYMELTWEVFPHKNCDVLIYFEDVNDQTDKYKTNILNELRTEFDNYRSTSSTFSSCKLVLINGHIDYPYNVSIVLNQLRAKDIEYIKIYNNPMNRDIYGEQGNVNGIIEIQTKQEGFFPQAKTDYSFNAYAF